MAPYFEGDERTPNIYGEAPPRLWDWFVLGGRWTGEHDGYESSKDPCNFSPCKYCNATGIRTDEVGKANGMDKTKTCNGCNGTGKSLNDSLVEHDGDIIEVSKVPPKFKCYTLIANDKVFEEREYITQKPYFKNTKFAQQTVKQKLAELGIKDGYLCTVDYHS